MGGRGICAGDHNSQIKMADHLRNQEIIKIRQCWEELRSENQVGTGLSGGSVTMMKRCACCRQFTLTAFSEYEKCPVCGWVDDPHQNSDPMSAEGCNPLSLQEARRQWNSKKNNAV